MQREKAREFFYFEPHGPCADADLHERILADGNEPAADAIGMQVMREIVGLSSEQIAAVRAKSFLPRPRSWDEDKHPRDPKGTATGGRFTSAEGAPSPSDSDKLLFVNEHPNTEKIEQWEKEIRAGLEALDKTSEAGTKQENELVKMAYAIDYYKQASQQDRDSGKKGLNAIYGGRRDEDNKLLAAVSTAFNPLDGTATIRDFGGIDADAQLKALQQVVRRFTDQKADRIEANEWADDAEKMALYEKAGFKPVGAPLGGLQKLVWGKAEREALTTHAATILGASKAAARLLGYDPNLVDISMKEYGFTVGGETKQRVAAGLAHLDTGRITIFPNHVTDTDVAAAVMAHEVEHQKYQTVMNALTEETKAVMADPGPPPNPDADNYPAQRGGSHAMMKPSGELRPPYDEKYPIYSRFWKHGDEALTRRIKTDGITEYSKAYWKQASADPPTVTLSSAQHETLAEMASRLVETGKLEGAPAWRSYYKDIEKTYDELKAAGKLPTRS